MTILVFCPNLVGDTAMATPAFRAIRQGYPDARIIAVIKPKIAATLDGGPWFDAVVGFDPRSKRSEERSLGVIRQLRRERPEIAVLFPNSYRSALMAFASGAKRRVGYARGGRGWLLTDRLAPIRDARGDFQPAPIVDAYLELARTLGCDGDGPRLDLHTTTADEQAADRAWGNLGLPTDRAVVVFNTGGAFGPAKSWPEAHFADLAQKLIDETDVGGILVVCGPGESAAARAIVQLADRPGVVSLADQSMSLGLTKACIRRAALLVTTDSGPRHFGVGFDVPTLGLFGPTHIAWTLTHHAKSLHLHHPVPCGPCQRPICPEGHHRCLRDLAPHTVFHAARRILAGRQPLGERIEAV